MGKLHAAAEAGDLALVRKLLDKGADVNAKDWRHQNSTPLHLAACYGHTDVARLLLERGAEADAPSDDQHRAYTPLHGAAVKGHAEVAKLLLERGAKPDVGNIYNLPLYMFAQRGDLALVKLLLDKGARVDGIGEQNPLSAAFGRGHVEVVAVLLARGASGASRCLPVAARSGHLAMVRLLLDNGADANAGAEGFSALHWAVLGDHAAVAELLMDRGADVSAEGGMGLSPLGVAAFHHHIAMVRLLLDRGADCPLMHKAAFYGQTELIRRQFYVEGTDVNARGAAGYAPLHFAALSGHAEVIDLLLTRGADVRACADVLFRATPLHLAALGGHAEVVALLLAKGADANDMDVHGQTALHGAVRSGRADLVELLLDHGADANATTGPDLPKLLADKRANAGAEDSQTALNLAVRSGRADLAELLLKSGANANATAKDGQTVLHDAVRSGSADLVKLLQDHGADLNAKGAPGLSPLNVAATARDVAMVALLLDLGADCPAMHKAAFAGQADVIKRLFYEGADVKAKDAAGQTALHYAALNGHAEASALLLARDADVKAKDSRGQTALHFAVSDGRADLVRLLREHGAEADAQDQAGLTPRLLAAASGLAEELGLLEDGDRPAGADTAHIKHLPGQSRFWRCPACGAVLPKRDSPGASPDAIVVGLVTCGGCNRTYPYDAVYGGDYDLPEVELNCPHCAVHLRGPAQELLGGPCPACGQQLDMAGGTPPAVASVAATAAEAPAEPAEHGVPAECETASLAAASLKQIFDEYYGPASAARTTCGCAGGLVVVAGIALWSHNRAGMAILTMVVVLTLDVLVWRRRAAPHNRRARERVRELEQGHGLSRQDSFDLLYSPVTGIREHCDVFQAFVTAVWRAGADSGQAEAVGSAPESACQEPGQGTDADTLS